MSLIKDLISIVGEEYVLNGKGKDTDQDELAAYLTDWRGRYTGRAQAIVRPHNAHKA